MLPNGEAMQPDRIRHVRAEKEIENTLTGLAHSRFFWYTNVWRQPHSSATQILGSPADVLGIVPDECIRAICFRDANLLLDSSRSRYRPRRDLSRRHPNFDSCPLHRRRDNVDRPANGSYSFAHARQAQAVRGLFSDRETNAIIHYQKKDSPSLAAKNDLGLGRPAVSHDIV